VARLYLTGITLGSPAFILTWFLLRAEQRFDGAFFFAIGSWLSFVLARMFAPRRAVAPLVVALLLLIGVAGPYTLGLSAGPHLALMSGVILGAAVFGRRVAFGLLAIGCGSIILTGALSTQGVVTSISHTATDPAQFANWLRLGAFFALSAGLLLMVLTSLLSRIEEAWLATSVAAERERQEQVQRHLAEERAIASQRLEALGRLAGGVAHDFNNLLVVILAWADMLPTAKLEEERKEGLDAIRQAATQAAQLTRQMLSFARKSVVIPRPIDLDAFCETTTRSLRRLLPDDVKLEFVPGSPPRALADEGQLGQVLLNLALNAGDAMPRGGELTIRTALATPPLPPEAPDRDGRYVTLTVADTGVGMDAATLARVFEPFFSTKQPGRGTGLGLATVYGIVSQAGGWVRAESEQGKGSTFTAAFPIATEAAPAPTASRDAPPKPLRHRILLVEDNAAVRSTMAAALRQAGIEPVEAENVDDALLLARRDQGELELLCTDGVMPGTPTQVLIASFRELFPSAPVLVCSGYVDEQLIGRGIAEGTVEALPKPFTAQELVAKVGALLARRAR